jgi:hypothetical protein
MAVKQWRFVFRQLQARFEALSHKIRQRHLDVRHHYLFSFIEAIFSWWSITIQCWPAAHNQKIKQWRKGSIAMALLHSHAIKLTCNIYSYRHFYMDRFAVYVTNWFAMHKTNRYQNSIIGKIWYITKWTLESFIYTCQHILSNSVPNITIIKDHIGIWLSFHSQFMQHGKYGASNTFTWGSTSS